MNSATEGWLGLLLAAWLVGGCGSATPPPDAAEIAVVPPPSPSATTDAPAPGPPPVAAEGPLSSVAWLVGTWSGPGPGGAPVEEAWSAPAGTVMRGEGRAVTGGAPKITETMTIEARPDGSIVLVARPEDAGSPTEFRSEPRLAKPMAVTFVNDAHDWPTRIRYERVGDELRITAKGRPGQSAESWSLRRVPSAP